MTKLDICNLALLRIGETKIGSLEETVKQAVVVSSFVQAAIDETIRVFPWNCTIRRVKMVTPETVAAWAATTAVTVGTYRETGTTILNCTTAGTTGATAPAITGMNVTDGTVTWRYVMDSADANLSGFSSRYLLPIDMLRVLDLNGSKSAMYRIEGRVLYSNESNPTLRYAKRIDVDDMDPVLVNAITSRLSSMISYPITSNEQLSQLLYQEFAVTVSMGRQVAAVEDREDMVDVLQLFTNANIALTKNKAQE